MLLYYTKSDQFAFTVQHCPYDEEYIKSHYRKTDEKGRRFRTDNVTAMGLSGGGYEYEWNGITKVWRYPKQRMQELHDLGRLHYTRTGNPEYIRFLDEGRGTPVSDVWTDIAPINSQAKERVGYPTQKPLALLDRIIRTSSNPNDVVLDPFCGCATACIASEKAERHWAGIDLSPKAADLVIQRAEREIGGLFKLNHREDIPRRSDQGSIPHYRTQKHTLFGRQEGYCNGCRIPFPFRNFTIDHVTPRSQGGTDHLENLQLLCGACNSTKGDRDQAYLLAALKRQNQHIAQTEAA